MGWGGALACTVALGAPALALLFEGRDEQTVPILQMLCVFLFVQGLGSVPLTWFEASERIVRTIPAELARNTCFAVLAIWLAVRGHGVWSIIMAHVAAATLYTIMLWLSMWRDVERGDVSLRWTPGATRTLVRASLPLMLLSIFELSVLWLEPLLLASQVPPEAVGLAGHALLLLFPGLSSDRRCRGARGLPGPRAPPRRAGTCLRSLLDGDSLPRDAGRSGPPSVCTSTHDWRRF